MMIVAWNSNRCRSTTIRILYKGLGTFQFYRNLRLALRLAFRRQSATGVASPERKGLVEELVEKSTGGDRHPRDN